MSSISVSVEDLVVAYGPLRILEGLSIDIRQGEFLVLLGSSGCGKSTLLNAIAGLQDVADGTISISGRDVTFTDPKDRGIGMVFQSYALYPRMTVRDNMSFGLKIRGMPRDEIAGRVRRAAEILHIGHLLDRRPSDLSGGQRQRVAIGRALVRDVDVFLFDEPLSNLDAQLRADLRVELKKLHVALGNTMIYVTHDQVEAMTLADRIAVMKDGRIQQLAAPGEIYSRPANLFVAGFIGAPKMNFVPGRIEGTRFQSDAIEIGIPRSPLGDQDAVLGIRPEDLSLAAGPGPACASGTVDLLEELGAETIVWVNLTETQRVSLRVRPEAAPQPGQNVWVDFDLAKASFFNADGGQRIDDAVAQPNH